MQKQEIYAIQTKYTFKAGVPLARERSPIPKKMW